MHKCYLGNRLKIHEKNHCKIEYTSFDCYSYCCYLASCYDTLILKKREQKEKHVDSQIPRLQSADGKLLICLPHTHNFTHCLYHSIW
jgi:hypothetical protein